MSDVVEVVERECIGRTVVLIGSQLTTASPAEDEVCAMSSYELVNGCNSIRFNVTLGKVFEKRCLQV